jgi:putative ABC transport system permease protein
VRWTDILRLSLTALYQHKLRTVLTTLGVACGCLVLVFSLSMGWGVQATIVREYTGYAGLRQIDVMPSYQSPLAADAEAKIEVKGVMSDERRQRLRHEMGRRALRDQPRAAAVTLTPERLKQLQAIPHVKAVVPAVELHGRAVFNHQAEDIFAHSAPPDHKLLRGRVVAGTFLESTRGDAAVVTEYLLYQLGVVDETNVAEVLGQKLRLEYRTGASKPHLFLMLFNAGRSRVDAKDQDLLAKVVKQLPAALDRMQLTPEEKTALRKTLQPRPATPTQPADVLLTRELTIVGVVRGPRPDDRREYLDWWADSADVVLPVQTATDLFFAVPANRTAGLNRTLVEADSPDDVKDVARAIKDIGLRAESLVELIEREQFTYLLMFGVMTCVAAVALIVAALGIINTMLISVLERTREIGIMKAVGARNGHILGVFLVEGALIGLVGGLLGLLAGWMVTQPGDAWVKSLVAARLKLNLEGSLFVWPVWLLVGAPLFAALVTTFAAAYPARRAAGLNPITALRHE